ncbi:sugar ABC transporter ATP-binding protein [Muricomes sp. OA1]|uniref:Sugar ABC transporter ATP-binding protein n=3 Tax=Lachnospiraceae TaxID=186803 RepID=A0A3E2WII2_9FIRM|nr:MULTISPECIES: sugar ABC transporter ATP-binding protein [Clostridia]MCH1972001.1 sugar ABC transporter ATP-binding protein [Muricomes sp. OA1]MRM88073.1 ATP-binding cassette domain-containing protein [Faecalicatena contorta]RGC26124.1 sugar ABC transporter ATP-binding protein [Hungatella hathewayi]GKH30802.1 ribose import ATP-binding protein RbsA [Faecalicatena contorta]
MSEAILQMRQITKSFSANKVLRGIDLEAYKGEVLALIGANGAGKSTMMNILCGIYQEDSGEILIDGKTVKFKNPTEAIEHGIAFVQQEMALMPTMSIVDNLFLNNFQVKRGLIDYKNSKKKCVEVLKKLGCHYSPDTLVGSLGAGDRQLVQISRALLSDPQIIIFDEATSSLTLPEKERLFKVIKQLREENVAIIYITHMMDEIFSICQRVMVLRGGITAGKELVSKVSHADLVKMMIGDKVEELTGHSHTVGKASEDAPVAMQVENVTRKGVVEGINFSIREGEVVGLWGLMGAGRTEVVRCITGLDPIDEGTISIADKNGKLKKLPPKKMIGNVAIITEDRRVDGLALEMSVKDNMTSANLKNLTGKVPGLLDKKKELEVCERYVKELETKVASLNQPISTLSGGNQQKVILGRWLQKDLKVFILDEPTRGLDIGAKADVMKVIHQLSEKGAAVLVIMSDIDELMSVSQRYLVMHNGKIVKELGGESTQTDLMAAALQ